MTIPSSTWGNRLLPMHDPRANVFPRGGGIGQGLGMGLGAALARPGEPVVVIAGDGGLAVHLGELLTLAQEGPRLLLLVFNDGGYGSCATPRTATATAAPESTCTPPTSALSPAPADCRTRASPPRPTPAR